MEAAYAFAGILDGALGDLLTDTELHDLVNDCVAELLDRVEVEVAESVDGLVTDLAKRFGGVSHDRPETCGRTISALVAGERVLRHCVLEAGHERVCNY